MSARYSYGSAKARMGHQAKQTVTTELPRVLYIYTRENTHTDGYRASFDLNTDTPQHIHRLTEEETHHLDYMSQRYPHAENVYVSVFYDSNQACMTFTVTEKPFADITESDKALYRLIDHRIERWVQTRYHAVMERRPLPGRLDTQ